MTASQKVSRHSQHIRRNLHRTLQETNLPELPVSRGKAADNYSLADGTRMILRTDRLTAFDQPLANIPYKGQVLTQVAGWWFDQVADIVPHHKLRILEPNTMLVEEVMPLPVEVVVRGFLTGVTRTSIWTMYARGERDMYGHHFADGMVKNEALPTPIITPTTKENLKGKHDKPLTSQDVVELRLIPARLWGQIVAISLALFARGQAIAAASGLILVDTKYEFGLTAKGELRLIDEIHTPDSSRFWRASSYAARQARGEEPEILDKEYVRLWYKAHGYSGDGPAPLFPEEEVIATSLIYIELCQRLTQTNFVPAPYPAEPRIIKALQGEGILH